MNQKVRPSTFIGICFTILGIIFLLIDFKELNLIAGFTLFSAFCSILTILIPAIISEENKKQITNLEEKIKENIESKNIRLNIDSIHEMLNDSVSYDALTNIESKHGRKNSNGEIWVISNTLQEAEDNNNSMVKTIYENITKNRMNYFYILPESSQEETKKLGDNLKDLYEKKKEDNFTGRISYYLFEGLSNLIPFEYFDIVLYIDLNTQGTNSSLDNSTEGYICLSKKLNNKDYFYRKIQTDKVENIQYFLKKSFSNKWDQLNIKN